MSVFESYEDLKQKMKEDGFEYLTEVKSYWNNAGFYSEVPVAPCLFGKKFGEMYIYNVGSLVGISEVEFIEERKILLYNDEGKLQFKVVNAKYSKHLRGGMSTDAYFKFPLK